MSDKIQAQLSERAAQALREGSTVVVATVGADGYPDTAPMSWVTAKDPSTLRLAIAQDLATLENIRANPKVRVALEAGGLNLSMKGLASVLKERMESIPAPTCLVEIRLEEVKDDSRMDAESAGDESWQEREGSVDEAQVRRELET